VQIRQSEPMLRQIGANLQDLLFAQIGNCVNRVELGDFGERTLLTAADEIAGVDQMPADYAVKRRPDFSIAEIQLSQRDLRLSPEQLRLRRRLLVNPLVDLGLGRRVLFDERRIPWKLGVGVLERGLRGEDLRLRLHQLILVLVLLDREQEVPFFDELAILVMDLSEIALDARD
jgi:hypothetical protein